MSVQHIPARPTSTTPQPQKLEKFNLYSHCPLRGFLRDEGFIDAAECVVDVGEVCGERLELVGTGYSSSRQHLEFRSSVTIYDDGKRQGQCMSSGRQNQFTVLVES